MTNVCSCWASILPAAPHTRRTAQAANETQNIVLLITSLLRCCCLGEAVIISARRVSWSAKKTRPDGSAGIVCRHSEEPNILEIPDDDETGILGGSMMCLIRLIAATLSLLIFSMPCFAQEWIDYSSRADFFAI